MHEIKGTENEIQIKNTWPVFFNVTSIPLTVSIHNSLIVFPFTVSHAFPVPKCFIILRSVFYLIISISGHNFSDFPIKSI